MMINTWLINASVSFGDNLAFYFYNVLDLAMLVMFLVFTIGLLILDWPKQFGEKVLLIFLAKAFVVYIVYFVFEALFFAFTKTVMPDNIQGIIFSASFAVVPTIYIFIFTKGNFIHKFTKAVVVFAACLTTSELGKDLGFIFGSDPQNKTAAEALIRIIPYLLVPVFTYMIHRFDIAKFKTLPRTLLAIAFSLSAVLVVSSIWQNMIETSDNNLRWLFIFLSTILLILLGAVIYSIYKAIDTRHKMTTLEVQTTIAQLEKESLEMDTNNREELMKIRHDLKNQLSYVNILLKDGKLDEAVNYLNELLEKKEEYLESFSCPNTVISGIVNLELTKAKIANKKIKFNVVVPPRLPFDDSDLLSLITNIADNCLENFIPKDDEDRIIVSIVTQQDYLRITSFNTVDVKMAKKLLTLRTTKDRRKHGYGTKIIKNIVNKYHGYSSFSLEGDQFVCDCLLEMTKEMGEKEND